MASDDLLLCADDGHRVVCLSDSAETESSEVTNVLENMTVNCREIKRVARFKGTLVFTDVGGRQVKWYNPSTKKVETLAGD